MTPIASTAATTITSAAGDGPPAQAPGKAMAAARDFESVFLSTYLKSMFEGIGNDPLTSGGTGSESWKELLVEEYGKVFARSGGIGLATQIAGDLMKIQEDASR